MIPEPRICVSFTGHRTYRDEARSQLASALEVLYREGFRTFLSGMALGFDLAAAEAVVALRHAHPDVRLVAVVPFRRQAARFPAVQRRRYEVVLARADEVVVLAEEYHRGCYARRNDFLVDHAAVLVAWYDGSPGGTHYTVERARTRGREIVYLSPQLPAALRVCEFTASSPADAEVSSPLQKRLF